jgi:preprotein translocase subunit SecA
MGTKTTSTARRERRGIRTRLSGDAGAARTAARTADLAVARTEELRWLSDTDLVELVDGLRVTAAEHGVDAVVVDGLAAAAVLSERRLKMTPYRVQLMGAAVLLSGSVAQMATGEGKTLVAILAAFVFSLEGRGVHVITPNDYLASRDAATARQLFAAVGATVGAITDDVMDAASRRLEHSCDVTYGSDSGFVFDYLRDHTFAVDVDRLISPRPPAFAIIDEIDAVLIDHARTPLILSGDATEETVDWAATSAAVAELHLGVHVVVDAAERAAHLTDAGVDALEAAFGIESLYSPENAALARGVYHALTAQFVFAEGVDYIVTGSGDDAAVSIIDATTGRQMPDTVWSNGLHQAVEAHKGLPVRPESQTWARISYQAYFRRYDRVSGMSGTAAAESEELARTFGLGCVEVPTNRPVARIDATDQVFSSHAAKVERIIADVAEAHDAGRPVLVGAATVESSEELSAALTAAGIAHRVLNARSAAAEAEVVSGAGRPGAVTVSTAMAGRGTDILLGGDPTRLAAAELAAEGIDPEDPDAAERVAAINAEVAQRCAADAEKVRDAGGLLVIGAERFEARRVDLQLRGRAGRQGDPGESRFYVSTQDPMVRIYGGTAQLIATLVSDSRPVSSKSITKMVERAQAAVEGRDAASRKQLLDWDAPLNGQRNEFYDSRDRWIRGEGVLDFVVAGIRPTVERVLGDVVGDDGELTHQALHRIAAVFSIGTDRLHDYEATALTPAISELNDLGNSGPFIDVFAGLVTDLFSQVVDNVGEAVAVEALRRVLLSVADREWREHLSHLDHLADAVHLRAPAGTPPLVVWASEAAEAFEFWYLSVATDTVRAALTLRPTPTDPTVGGLVLVAPTEPTDEAHADADDVEGAAGEETPENDQEGPSDSAAEDEQAEPGDHPEH